MLSLQTGMIAKLMGPKGSNINNITRSTGCVIVVPKNHKEGESVVLSVLADNGNADALCEALKMISQVFD